MADNDQPVDARATILCIDDDPEISETVALRLQQYDVEVLRAYHGMHGLWLAKTNRPDLIITDMRMPQGTGDHIIECLRANSDTRRIPIIVLTGQRNPRLEAIAHRLRVEKLLTKPVHFKELVAAIRTFIPLNTRRRNEIVAEL